MAPSRWRPRCETIVEGDQDADGIVAKYTVAVRLNDKGVVEIDPVKVENERE